MSRMVHRGELPPVHVQREMGVDVKGLIGQGAAKLVYLAKIVSTEQIVVLTSEKATEQAKMELAVMERLLSTPPHPHIIGPPAGMQTLPRLHDPGERRIYTVMEKAEQTVLDLMMDGGRGRGLGEEQSRRLFVQMLCGLRFMHANGVAHHDIKPENVMLMSDGTLKLVDFGGGYVCVEPGRRLFRPREPSFDTGMRSGTRSYMAPEVLEHLRHDARKADVWSLAMTLYALLTGTKLVNRPEDRYHWTFMCMRQAEAEGTSSVRAVLARHDQACTLSDDLVTLLDGMIRLTPDARLSLDDIVQCEWVRGAYESYLAKEATYTTKFMARRRLSKPLRSITTAVVALLPASRSQKTVYRSASRATNEEESSSDADSTVYRSAMPQSTNEHEGAGGPVGVFFHVLGRLLRLLLGILAMIVPIHALMSDGDGDGVVPMPSAFDTMAIGEENARSLSAEACAPPAPVDREDATLHTACDTAQR